MTISEAIKKKWQDPEYRLKITAGQRRSWTPERRERQRQRMLGNKPSEETINKISESNIKTWRENGRANGSR